MQPGGNMFPKRLWVVGYSLVIVALSMGLNIVARADDFDEELDFLRRQDVGNVGRSSKVEAYEEFIARHQSNTHCAVAMLELATLWETTVPQTGEMPSAEESLKWCQRAAKAAAPGSEDWILAMFRTCGHLTSLDRDTEASSCLEEIAKNCSDSLTLARVEHGRQQLALSRGDIDAAELHCQRILRWYDTPERIPSADRDKFDLDQVIQSSGRSMVDGYLTARWSKDLKRERIEALADKGASFMYRIRTNALARLKEMPETPPEEPTITSVPAANSGRLRTVVIVANLLILVLIIILFARGQRTNP